MSSINFDPTQMLNLSSLQGLQRSGKPAGAHKMQPMQGAGAPPPPPELDEEAKSKLSDLAEKLGYDSPEELGKAIFEAKRNGDSEFLSKLDSTSNELFGENFEDALGIKPPQGYSKPGSLPAFGSKPMSFDISG